MVNIVIADEKRFKEKTMRKISGSTRIRILAVVIVVVLLWLAYKNYNDYSEAQIEAVILIFSQ